MDAAKRDELLRLAGTDAIRLTAQDGSTITVGNTALQPAGTVDLRQEDLFGRIGRALDAILLRENRLIQVTGDSPVRPDPQLEMWLHERALNRALWQFAVRFCRPGGW